MTRKRASLLTALLLLGLVGTRWLRTATEPVASGPTPPVAAAAVASSAQPDAPVFERPAQPLEAPAQEPRAIPDRSALWQADPVLRDRAQQQRWAPEADARWERAVDEGSYRANDLDPAVRDLFHTLDLEPRYAAEGRIEGLVISSLPLDHPLGRAGFRPGDRIDRIQGVPLRDPADLPSLLARLGPNLSVCAERKGVELCRELRLE